MAATVDNAVADLQRTNAELHRQLDAPRCRNSGYGERIEQQSATIDVLKVMFPDLFHHQAARRGHRTGPLAQL